MTLKRKENGVSEIRNPREKKRGRSNCSTMETEVNEESMTIIKEMRQQLESRADSLHSVQLDLIASLQTTNLVPGLVSSLDISLKAISSFHPNKPFTPLSQILPSQPLPIKPHPISKIPSENNPKLPSSAPLSRPSPRALIEESGGPLSVVRSMVAVCLLERVPFNAIDSSTVLRKLENDSSATVAERAAPRELGGELGAIHAVEMALRSMAEDNGGVELDEIVVSGKSGLMVMNIDRTRLLKELPETKQLNEGILNSNDGQMVGKSGESLIGGGGFSVGRGMPEMWMPGPMMMGPKGMGMNMIGVPKGVGVPPPMQRQPLMLPSLSMKPRTEEEDMKDLEALINKKSFKEMQKSKTGEELLDLIHRPTAKETAVAAKVWHFLGGSTVLMLVCFGCASGLSWIWIC